MKKVGFYFVLFFVLAFVLAEKTIAQPLSIAVDSSCGTGFVNVKALGTGTFLGWKIPTNGLDSMPALSSTAITIKPKSIQTLTAQMTFQTANYVANGNFDLGNINVGTEYSYKDTAGFKSGQIVLTANPRTISSAFVTKRDRSGNGQMLLADGALDSTQIKFFYKQTITVEQGKTYEFKGYFANIHREFLKTTPDSTLATSAVISIWVDGNELIRKKLTTDTSWNLIQTTYVATASGSVSLGIKDLNYFKKGNDFVADDIQWTTTYKETITAQVWPCPKQITTPPDTVPSNPTTPVDSVTQKPKPIPVTNDKVFSPNGDGNYDLFYIPGTGKAAIFTLDGQKIQSLDAPGYWDGKMANGQPAPMGYYAIVVGEQQVIRVSLVK